jgi:hypothetical protein
MSTGIGTNTIFDRVLAEYLPYQDRQTLWEELAEDETNALLLALLLETSGRSIVEEDRKVNETATYFSETYTVGVDGPASDGEEVDGTKVDFGFVADKVDLRIDDTVVVAFSEPGKTEHREITYRQQDSPLAGIPASSRYVWVRRADSATTDPTVRVEAWP